jgi:electron transport complex protein RnfB
MVDHRAHRRERAATGCTTQARTVTGVRQRYPSVTSAVTRSLTVSETRRSGTLKWRMHALATTVSSRIDALLPQTQCTRCGYADCRAYADAVATGAADIDRCPPGGETTIAALAALTGRPVKPLNRACGEYAPLLVARIDEAACIGCTLCIAACPVDAIIGGPKRMHSILASLCSGCGLCVAPCPVACIDMQTARRPWTDADADAARARHEARRARLTRAEGIGARHARLTDRARRLASVAAATARARARRNLQP